MPQSLISDMLQCDDGYLWISTRNGLVRYDGYRAELFRGTADAALPTNRILKISLDSAGDILCRIDTACYRFSRRDKRFLVAESSQKVPAHSLRVPDSIASRVGALPEFRGIEFSILCHDREGGWWVVSKRGVDRILFDALSVVPQPTGDNAEEVVRAIAGFGSHILIANKLGQVMLVNHSLKPELWLDSHGKWVTVKAEFGANAYCFEVEEEDSSLWIGTRHKGIFRIREGVIDTIPLPRGHSVYTFARGPRGTLYAGSYDGGLFKISGIGEQNPLIEAVDGIRSVRALVPLGDSLLLAATDATGVYALRMDQSDARPRHMDLPGLYEPVMDIDVSSSGRIYAATYGDGLFSMDISRDGLPSDIKHYTTADGLADNICISVSQWPGGKIGIVGDHTISIFDEPTATFAAHRRSLSETEFNFTEGKPLIIGDTVMLATNKGVLTLCPAMLWPKAAKAPKIVFSCPDTLILPPNKRSLSISFSALTYNRNDDIRYAYRIGDNDSIWHITTDNTVHFANLPPGTFRLYVRSTDGYGNWHDNESQVTLGREAYFTETAAFHILLGALALLIIAGAVAAWRLIRSLRNELRQLSIEKGELSEYYNARFRDIFLPTHATDGPGTDSSSLLRRRVDNMLAERFADPSMTADEMGRQLAMSRTKLYKEIKSVFGMTPNTLILDYRLQRACAMLAAGSESIAQVAYACGWSDPKYFSRVFRKAKGMTPSEYMAATQAASKF